MIDWVKSAIAWFVRDKNGKVVLWQTPNLPLIIWFLCFISSYLPLEDEVKTGLAGIGRAFLLAWAYMEITDGASKFRRMLAAIVMVGILVSFFR